MKKISLLILVIITIIVPGTLLLLRDSNIFYNSSLKNTEIIPLKAETTSSNNNSDWSTFTNTEFSYPNLVYSGYSFNYPSNCNLEEDYLLNCPLNSGNFILTINASGHGGSEGNFQALANNQVKNFPPIEGNFTAIKDLDTGIVFGTYWINQTDALSQEPIFGFEFGQINFSDYSEFIIIFDQILSTFKFIQ